ncbi:hypothetical protein FJV41_36595 [Myxococcus llanfairpwllgwyngyllgogerychwyrndrobwllllantysiliogogogochensis]|uniref:RCC1 repeat-containing protein n=2 Tax=Myxococcus TaxID=32 RepID=A0A540WQ36_9BACT|nr:hypothetical protein FJV41_36595 [Myxococcus llanfairpwllgwyngyllgogerychwyrndrobwllllantysiliogogogochensis]
MSVAIKADGTLWVWGTQSTEDGTISRRFVPVPMPGPTGIVAASARSGHTLARTADGTVWGWGHNAYGALGNGITGERSEPFQLW